MFKYFIISFLFFQTAVFAQSNLQFTSYTINDGLPQSSIWDIIQDKNGFLWASTADGLCRFDGYKFTIYKNHPNDPHSIVNGNFNHFFIDDQQRLWVSSANGISLYDDVHDNFKNLFIYNTNSLALSEENPIYGEYDGCIWAGLNQYGFVAVNTKTLRAKLVKLAGDIDLSLYKTWSRGFIENGNIYGNNEKGFFRYTIASGKFIQLNVAGGYTPLVNLNQSEVVSCSNTSLFFIDKSTLSARTYPISLEGRPFFINDFYKINDRELILGTLDGLYYIDPVTKKVVNHISDVNSFSKSAYSDVQCFYTDRSGTFWMGTNGDGLRKAPNPFKKFSFYNSHSLKSNLVKSVCALGDKVYIGYFNNGIDVFSKTKGFEQNIVLQKNIENSVINIFPVNNNLFIINRNSGRGSTLYTYSFSGKKATDITRSIKKAVPLADNIFSFAHYAGDIVAAAANAYLFSIKFINGAPAVTQTGLLKGEIINNLFVDDDKTIWAATDDGLYRIKNNQPQKIELGKDVECKTVNKDSEGNIWVGGLEGIYVVDKKNKIKYHFTESNGLLNQFIYGILRDNNGDMWFSTNKGLGRYKWREKKFDFFTKGDGLQSDEFDTGAYFKAADGELFFGGTNGTNSFYPKDIKNNPFTPPVKITAIKLFDEPYKTDSAYWNVRTLTLPYTDNTLGFEFALPEYTNEQKNNYAYRMDGVDNNWIKSGDKRFARYTSLVPGDYTFMVKAANNDGLWGKPTYISITIIPPFWQRAWFIIVCVVSGVSAIWLIISAIQKQKYKRQMQAFELQQKVQRERERISRDLHDNVGTQLSLINKTIEGILQPHKPIAETDREANLINVSQTSKEVIATLRETIWALNKEEVTLEEFSDKLRAYAQKQSKIYAHLSLHYTACLENDNTLLNSTEAIHLFRICQEAIANSLKYAEASNLTINLSVLNGKYQVTIADDGIGFDGQGQPSAPTYGIENMKHRAKEIHCDFILKTGQGKSTVVTIIKNSPHATI